MRKSAHTYEVEINVKPAAHYRGYGDKWEYEAIVYKDDVVFYRLSAGGNTANGTRKLARDRAKEIVNNDKLNDRRVRL